ncbi:reverse transcriptase/maturase family protein [Patescibacteria group bacterium]|nr:reverse transcriptase/maturase family protein [Patescibacteria group bacterium]
MEIFDHKYNDIISIENLLDAWTEFLKGKRKKKDVQLFSFNLMDNIFKLHSELSNHTYRHRGYQAFNISDPRPRNIHKAAVRDRIVHHAVHRVLYPSFDKIFISDSFSCRIEKGTHKGINKFKKLFYKVSKNNTRNCWALKCDIKKFFDSIDHTILYQILKKRIPDKYILWLLKQIIVSFNKDAIQLSLFGEEQIIRGRGIPIGNLTSQLFANIYLNEFDQFIKHGPKIKHYLRYADDFVILDREKTYLINLIPKIERYLNRELRLFIHPNKLFIKTVSSGIDFLGWVNFPNHRVLRTTTKRRMYKRIIVSPNESTRQSYLGLIKHGNTYKVKVKFENLYQNI